MKKRKIGIIGIGFVGSVLKRYLEGKGYKRGEDLFCLDNAPAKKCADDIGQADIVFVSVPTPSLADGSCDTSILEDAIKGIPGRKTVVIRSTVAPGTTDMFARKNPQHTFLFYPEFLTEARAYDDFMRPSRQILAPTKKGKALAREILKLLPKGAQEVPRESEMRPASAELGKLGANGFGSIKVAYANILADICEGLKKRDGRESADYEDVRNVLASDTRIGPSWLNVHYENYRGFGGFCFPKDFRSLIADMGALIKDLRNKKAPQANFARLEAARKALKAILAYNETLLKTQGLTLEDVSQHTDEVAKIISRRRPSAKLEQK